MGRNRLAVKRTPTGIPSRAAGVRETAVDPTTIRRLIEIAASDARREQWGTVYGRMLLEGKLTERQYAACKKWAERAADYRKALAAQEAKSSMYAIDPTGGASPDPDSEAGAKIAKRDRRIMAEYEAAKAMLEQVIGGVEFRDFIGAVEHVGTTDFPYAEASAIRKCAAQLVNYWGM